MYGEMTDRQLALAERMAAAVLTVELRLGPNALRMAAEGPVRLSGGEASRVAYVVLGVVEAELARHREQVIGEVADALEANARTGDQRGLMRLYKRSAAAFVRGMLGKGA